MKRREAPLTPDLTRPHWLLRLPRGCLACTPALFLPGLLETRSLTRATAGLLGPAVCSTESGERRRGPCNLSCNSQSLLSHCLRPLAAVSILPRVVGGQQGCRRPPSGHCTSAATQRCRGEALVLEGVCLFSGDPPPRHPTCLPEPVTGRRAGALLGKGRAVHMLQGIWQPGPRLCVRRAPCTLLRCPVLLHTPLPPKMLAYCN